MKTIGLAAVACSAIALVACGDSDDDKADAGMSAGKCPKSAAQDASYSGKFAGPVTMKDSKHVVQVTRSGKPVEGAEVCVNTAMVGMKSMHYTATASELAPGRYQVPVKFEMKGTYKGNVVTRVGGKEISVPFTVKVASGDEKMDSDDKMDSKSHEKTNSDDKMKSDDKMETGEMDSTDK